MAKRDRFFAGFGAALFLVTSSALTIAVILSASHNNSPTTPPASNASKSNSIAAVAFKLGSTLPTQLYNPNTPQPTSLKYTDVVKGTGSVVKPTDKVKADYVGFLLSNGKVFDDSGSHGGAITFSLNQVIPGWTEGISGMRVGGTRELFIPANLAYGSQGNSSIPANSNLGFYVQIESISN